MGYMLGDSCTDGAGHAHVSVVRVHLAQVYAWRVVYYVGGA